MRRVKAHSRVQERLWVIWSQWNRAHNDNSMNADPLEKLSQRNRSDAHNDRPESRPTTNHNYVRFEAGELLFRCDLLSAANINLR